MIKWREEGNLSKKTWSHCSKVLAGGCVPNHTDESKRRFGRYVDFVIDRNSLFDGRFLPHAE